jgi:glycosyltransferase involved in cell wall biosynthesis
MNEQKRLLLIVNTPSFFLSHRLPVALAAQREGYEVHVATAMGIAVSEICSRGFIHHVIPLTRSGKNPFTEFRSLCAILVLFRKIKPDLVHLVTIKPVIYGGLAARIARVPGIVAAVSGLGFIFIAKGLKAKIYRSAIVLLYRLALDRNNIKVIFQNKDDCNTLVQLGVVDITKVIMIPGSGVDLTAYSVKAEPVGVPVVAMATRMLKYKGVLEFIEAAAILRKQKVLARFVLIGAPDPGNPATFSQNEITALCAEGGVELFGYRNDIAELFAASNIVVLPSYGEGLPKVLVEAAACGRAVVTTDIPGCRDAIEPGKTGLLVPVKNAVALADAIGLLLENPDLRKQMGQAGRKLAEREFAIDKIVSAHLVVYRSILT